MCHIKITFPGEFNDSGVFLEYGREDQRATCVQMDICSVT